MSCSRWHVKDSYNVLHQSAHMPLFGCCCSLHWGLRLKTRMGWGVWRKSSLGRGAVDRGLPHSSLALGEPCSG